MRSFPRWPAHRIGRIEEADRRHGRRARSHRDRDEAFLPYHDCDTIVLELTDQERSQKQQLLACYATQKQTLAAFPLRQEMFRFAPSYDFTRLRHPAPLFYDHFHWGVTSPGWQELARAAIKKVETTKV
jgi:hypothetical protein